MEFLFVLCVWILLIYAMIGIGWAVLWALGLDKWAARQFDRFCGFEEQ